ncbi:phage tail tape measure protein [Variovorax sp.]|uniref:phage tail tape measure protein n=1 Tax=Variovorax sp. TaxID=1871043 RepID=UPI003BA89CF0
MSATVVKQIGVRVAVDATGVKPATREVAADIASIGKQAQTTATTASAALDRVSTSTSSISAPAAAAARDLEQLGRAGQAAGRQAEQAIHKAGVSANQTRAAMRMLPAQMTDIGVGLATGQSPLTVALQQGGQLKDMFGGIGPAMRAMGQYVLGLVNPYTVAAAAAGGFALAINNVHSQTAEANKALILTGNYVGQTASSLAVASAKVQRDAGSTYGEASDALNAVVAMGRIGADTLNPVAAAVAATVRATGVAAAEAAANYAKLAEEPTKASAKLNESQHYLTQTTYERIKSLEDQGKKEEAAALAQKTYADASIDRMKAVQAQAHIFSRAFTAAIDVALNAWNRFGKAITPEIMLPTGEQLTRAQQRMASLAGGADHLRDASLSDAVRSALGGYDKVRAEAQARITSLSRRMLREDDNAYAQGQSARDNETAIQASEAVSKWQGKAKTVDNLTEALKKYRLELEDIRRVNPKSAMLEPSAIKAGEDAIRKEFKPEKGRNTADADAHRAIEAQIEAVREGYKVMALKTAEGLDVIDSLRKRDLLSETQAIQRRRDLQLQDLDNREQSLKRQLEISKRDKHSERQQETLQGQLREVGQQRVNIRGKADRDLDEALVAPQLALVKATKQATQAANEQALAQEQQNRVHGLGKAAVMDLTIAQLEKQRADLEATDKVIPGYVEQLELQIDAAKRLRAATYVDEVKDSDDKTWKERQEEARKQSDEMKGVFRQGVMDALDNKDAFSAMGQSIKRTIVTSVADAFYDTFLKDVVNQFAQTLKASMADAFGDGGKSSSGGSFLGWAGRLLGMASGAGGGGMTVGDAAEMDALVQRVRFNAKGDVYSSPSLSAYSNGIYDRPQVFAFAKGAGIFGEAGPEAIMPLQRDSQGRLGVMSAGGGGGASVSGGLTFAPVNHFHMDSRVDRGAAMADLNRALSQNNRAQFEQLQRLKVAPQ